MPFPAEQTTGHGAIVRRRRLVDLVREATASPFTVLNAPAGYGKSIAVTDFLQASGSTAAWVGLDEADDQHSFWRKALVSLEAANIDPGPAAAAAFGGREMVDDSFLLGLLDDAARLDHTAFLVLDDLHLLRDRAVLDQLAFLVNRLPPKLRFVAATRQSPGLPIGRWRAQDRVAEIGQDELRFAPGEAKALFEQLGINGLGPHELDALIERAEGWPAGMQLLAESLRESRQRPPGSPTTGWPLDSPAARHLADGLLAGQPADVQEFVLATSVLRRFSADLCRAVTGREDAGRLLQAVEEANLFIVSLDEGRQWFRYRRLFAELMQWRLEQRDPGAAAELRRRAARWFERHGDAREALGHLVAAGEVDQAFLLANENAYRPWREDSFLRTDWGSVFSLDWIKDDPARMIYFAALLGRSGWLDQAKGWIDRAEEALRGWASDDPRHALLVAVRALWHGIHIDARPTLELGHEAMAMLGDQPGADLLHQRLLVAFVNARIALGDYDGAGRDCDALDETLASGVLHDIVVPAMRARLALHRGQLQKADELGRRGLRTAETMGLQTHPSVRDAHLAVGGVLAERGQLDAAEASITSAVDMADMQGWGAIAAAARVDLAKVRAARLSPRAGLVLLDATRRSIDGTPAGPELVSAIDALEARLRIERGELERAAELIATLPPGVGPTLLWVRVALAQGDTGKATRLLATASPRDLWGRITVHLLSARAVAETGRSRDRDRHLLAAAHLGQADGYCRIFVDEAPELLRRLRELVEPQPELSSLASAIGAGPSPARAATEELTERETAVLRLLPSQLTNQEIAARLEISANTLKTHTRALYRKLGVSSRSDAVAAARRAALL